MHFGFTANNRSTPQQIAPKQTTMTENNPPSQLQQQPHRRSSRSFESPEPLASKLDKLISTTSKGFAGLETKISGVETELGGVKTELSGVKTELSGMETKISGVETKLSGVETELKTELGVVQTELGGVKTELKTELGVVQTELGGKLDRIIDNLPAAAQFPNVTLAAPDKHVIDAQRGGGYATWSYGHFDGKPVLVSSLHNLVQVERKTDKNCGTASLVFQLSQEVVDDLSEKKLKVLKIGFHKDLYANNFQKFPMQHDFVLLELDAEPDAATFVEIGSSSDAAAAAAAGQAFHGFQNVAGKSLSGTVYGKGLVYNDVTKCFTFVAEFYESGNSGTAMFAIDNNGAVKFIGIFKGLAAKRGGGTFWQRGIIVPVPTDPSAFKWLKVFGILKHQDIHLADDSGQHKMCWDVNEEAKKKSRLVAEFPSSFPPEFKTKKLFIGSGSSFGESVCGRGLAAVSDQGAGSGSFEDHSQNTVNEDDSGDY